MHEEYTKLSAGAFDSEKGQWILIDLSAQNIDCDRLTSATFNIWFGDYFAEQRYKTISDLLKENRPDFIALQEVTLDALELFLAQHWIQKEYYVSDIDGSTLGDYGIVILSRLPLSKLTLQTLPSYMGRDLLTVETKVNGSSLCIGTVHLESRKQSTAIREIQMKTIFASLKDVSNAVLMGDFNFCSSWHEENDRIDLAYEDLWSHLRGGELGYTEDTAINRMRYLMKGKHKQVRFDRILLKSTGQESGWLASSIKLIGTEPISPQQPDVFPSDHFGLIASLSKR